MKETQSDATTRYLQHQCPSEDDAPRASPCLFQTPSRHPAALSQAPPARRRRRGRLQYPSCQSRWWPSKTPPMHPIHFRSAGPPLARAPPQPPAIRRRRNSPHLKGARGRGGSGSVSFCRPMRPPALVSLLERAYAARRTAYRAAGPLRGLIQRRAGAASVPGRPERPVIRCPAWP